MPFNRKKAAFDSHLIGIAFVLSILLPHSGILYLINPVLLLYLAYRYSSMRSIPLLQLALVGIIVVSVIWNLMAGVTIAPKSLIRSLFIAELFLFFPFCGDYRLPNRYIFFVVFVILLSQLCYILNYSPLISFFNQVYPYTGTLDSESVDYLVSHSQEAGSFSELEDIRFGGLFHNSNQCMKYVSLCTIAYVLENHGKPIAKFIPFLILVFICALLAGSRTGFVIIVLTLLFAFSFRGNRNGFIVFILLSIIGTLLFILFLSFQDSFRLFQLSEGLSSEGSLGIKYANFHEYYIRIDSLRAFLVGNASLESIRELYEVNFTQFDSEWGNAIYFYGFSFFLFYLLFLVGLVGRRLKGIYKIAGFILLWIISSTVLFSFRTSFAFLLLASKYVNASKRRI